MLCSLPEGEDKVFYTSNSIICAPQKKKKIVFAVEKIVYLIYIYIDINGIIAKKNTLSLGLSTKKKYIEFWLM